MDIVVTNTSSSTSTVPHQAVPQIPSTSPDVLFDIQAIKTVVNSVKNECKSLRLEVSSIALQQEQMRQEFKHVLLSVDNRLSSLQTALLAGQITMQKHFDRNTFDMSKAERTPGEADTRMAPLGSKTVLPEKGSLKIDSASEEFSMHN